MPKLFEAFGFIFYFWANEYSGGTPEPVHIHFTNGSPSPNAPKIWINGDGVSLWTRSFPTRCHSVICPGLLKCAQTIISIS